MPTDKEYSFNWKIDDKRVGKLEGLNDKDRHQYMKFYKLVKNHRLHPEEAAEKAKLKVKKRGGKKRELELSRNAVVTFAMDDARHLVKVLEIAAF